MDLFPFLKKSLTVLLAMLSGLFLGLQLLEAHSPSAVSSEKADTEIIDVVKTQISSVSGWLTAIASNDKHNTVPLDSPQAKFLLPEENKPGKALAIVVSESYYYVDKNCNIVGKSDSLFAINLPLITGKGFEFDIDKGKISHTDIHDAVTFVDLIRQKNQLLFYSLSELHLDNKVGIIAYMNESKVLPMIIGRDDIERKLDYCIAFFTDEKTRQLVFNAKFIDLRVNGQILLKKNV